MQKIENKLIDLINDSHNIESPMELKVVGIKKCLGRNFSGKLFIQFKYEENSNARKSA